MQGEKTLEPFYVIERVTIKEQMYVAQQHRNRTPITGGTARIKPHFSSFLDTHGLVLLIRVYGLTEQVLDRVTNGLAGRSLVPSLSRPQDERDFFPRDKETPKVRRFFARGFYVTDSLT